METSQKETLKHAKCKSELTAIKINLATMVKEKSGTYNKLSIGKKNVEQSLCNIVRNDNLTQRPDRTGPMSFSSTLCLG